MSIIILFQTYIKQIAKHIFLASCVFRLKEGEENLVRITKFTPPLNSVLHFQFNCKTLTLSGFPSNLYILTTSFSTSSIPFFQYIGNCRDLVTYKYE